MVLVVNASNRGKFAADLAAMHCQRKALFVERTKWNIPGIADREIERYDLLQETVYLLAKDEPHGPVLASTRLLTTAGPHLLQDLHFAAYSPALPSGPTVWEVSRYCTAPGIGGRSRQLRLLWEIICGILEAGPSYGFAQVLFAATRALLPLALECGWEARTVGPTIVEGDHEITAVLAQVTPCGLQTVRDRHAVPEPVIRITTATGSDELPSEEQTPSDHSDGSATRTN